MSDPRIGALIDKIARLWWTSQEAENVNDNPADLDVFADNPIDKFRIFRDTILIVGIEMEGTFCFELVQKIIHSMGRLI